LHNFTILQLKLVLISTSLGAVCLISTDDDLFPWLYFLHI